MKQKLSIFIKNNVFMLYYIISSIIMGLYLRIGTVGNPFYIRPFIIDLAVVLIVSFFINLFCEKNKKKFYLIFILLSTILCFINSIYYKNYTSYASISLIATALQLDQVEKGSFLGLLKLKEIFYLLPIIGYCILIFKIKTIEYVNIKKNKYFSLILAAFLVTLSMIGLNKNDISSFLKQWNREYTVMHFGIYAYQINDIFVSLEPKLFPLLGYDEAKKNLNNYYNSLEEIKENEYTNIFKDKNVLVIHAESIQNFVLNLKLGGKEVAPNLKRLASEGLYFSNFYAEESVGTSSDSEFTFATSILPTVNGTVFVNYADRKFISIQSLLTESNYYTFSMHGNNASFWNRDVMHKNLGYQKFFDASTYEIDEFVGLGLSDKSFFKQSVEKIKKISEENDKFYGTLITLTNHTPFTGLHENGITTFDLTFKQNITKNGRVETVTDDHLEDTKIGHYLESVNYADQAIGEFIDELDKSGLLENTVIIIYGDHDAKLSKASYQLLYNYDLKTDSVKDENDEGYINIDQMWLEINRKVPFIIWTKDKNINLEVKEVMGMIDVLPTLGNMLGVKSKYQLGHDIFNVEENIVVFPKGNWMTNKIYFDAQREEYYQLDYTTTISLDYIAKYNKYADDILKISNDIIKYDLLRENH